MFTQLVGLLGTLADGSPSAVCVLTLLCLFPSKSHSEPAFERIRVPAEGPELAMRAATLPSAYARAWLEVVQSLLWVKVKGEAELSDVALVEDLCSV